jgi:hypothetical protein
VEFSVTHSYRRPPADVFELFTDFDRVREKYEALGHRDVELVDLEEDADGAVRIVTRRVVPLELPGFAKRVLSPHQVVTQTDEWSAPDAKGVRTGRFEVDAKGTPVQVRGTLRLAPKGRQQCTNDLHVTVECKLPLIGGRIAGFVAGDTRRAVDHEQAWTRAHLGAG